MIAAAGGLYFAFSPAATPLDRLVASILPNHSHSRPLRWIVAHGLPAGLVVGAMLSCVVCLPRDRRRALSCLVAPAIAIAIADYVMKPLVGRSIPGGHTVGLSYPSGHMTATAAVVAVAVLAVPPGWRRWALVIGVAIDIVVASILILLRYHYATDILGGGAVAVGTTLLTDTAVHLLPAPGRLGSISDLSARREGR